MPKVKYIYVHVFWNLTLQFSFPQRTRHRRKKDFIFMYKAGRSSFQANIQKHPWHVLVHPTGVLSRVSQWLLSVLSCTRLTS